MNIVSCVLMIPVTTKCHSACLLWRVSLYGKKNGQIKISAKLLRCSVKHRDYFGKCTALQTKIPVLKLTIGTSQSQYSIWRLH